MILNNIYNNDSVLQLKEFPDNSIDLILTSPPYDDLRFYGNKDKKELENSWNYETFKKIAKECSRVLKDGGVIIWVVNDATINESESGTSFKQALYFKEECCLKLFDTMIYSKSSFAYPSKNKYHQLFEYMFVFSKGNPKTFNPIEDRINKYFNVKRWGKYTTRLKNGELENVQSKDLAIISKNFFGKRNNIWQYSTGSNVSTTDKIAFEHPAIFPEMLAIDNILSWTNENDIVLDPFCGSGTTVKAAKILKRNFIGIELNKNYIPIIEERLKIADTIEIEKYTSYLKITKEKVIKKLKKEIKEKEALIARLELL